MADRPNFNPTPRQVFLADELAVKAHRTLMEAPYFHQVIDVALMQYQRVMCDARTSEGNTAAQNHFKTQGVYEFIGILKNLSANPEIPATKIDNTKLDYNK